MSADPREMLQASLTGVYAIERELGGGGMSRVFVAHETALGRRVVVKLLGNDALSAGSIERFKREIAVAARLHHPHVVPLLAAGEASGIPWYTMPLVEGETLRSRLERSSTVPLHEAVRILRHVAEALSFAHARGIVHRDVKPENILLSGSHALLTDFGIAKAISVATQADAEGLTGIGMALGTPAYMAPEQVAADPMIDHRADVYAFGVVAYELLAGEHPFAGRSPHAMLAAHLTEVPEPPTRHRMAIPPSLAAVVVRCLAKDPRERPPSVDAILHAIDSLDTHAPREGKPSIAVLPMVNLGGDPGDEHFSDGLTDELIGVLGQVQELAVSGRTSVFALKGKGLDVRTIADTLGVANVLEGTVRRAGARLKIRVQLVDPSGVVHWSAVYDRVMTDVFEVQEEIAQAVVAALKVQLTEARKLVRPATEDMTAYDLFLRGSFVHRRLAHGDLESAITYYERAVARDPRFARAHAAMADAHTLLSVFAGRAAAAVLPVARDCAERALALDGDHADSHWARAHVAMTLERDAARATSEFQQALALDPGHTDARHLYAILLMFQQRFAEAEEHLQRVLSTNPLHATACMTLGQVHTYSGEFDRGIRSLTAALELVPELYYAREQLVHAYIRTGDHDRAVAESERVAATGGARGAAVQAYALAVAGRTAEARAMVDRLLQSADTYPPPAHIAMVLTALGDVDDALSWLERGFAEADSHLVGFHFRYEFQRLHGQPRFEALVRQRR